MEEIHLTFWGRPRGLGLSPGRPTGHGYYGYHSLVSGPSEPSFMPMDWSGELKFVKHEKDSCRATPFQNWSGTGQGTSRGGRQAQGGEVHM